MVSTYSPKNERIKKVYFDYQREARGKALSTIDAIRKALDRFEDYTGHKDFAGFNREQAKAFKKHFSGLRSVRQGEPMAGSTMVATTNTLKEFSSSGSPANPAIGRVSWAATRPS
jgi:hypothetical protein